MHLFKRLSIWYLSFLERIPKLHPTRIEDGCFLKQKRECDTLWEEMGYVELSEYKVVNNYKKTNISM